MAWRGPGKKWVYAAPDPGRLEALSNALSIALKCGCKVAAIEHPYYDEEKRVDTYGNLMAVLGAVRLVAKSLDFRVVEVYPATWRQVLRVGGYLPKTREALKDLAKQVATWEGAEVGDDDNVGDAVCIAVYTDALLAMDIKTGEDSFA